MTEDILINVTPQETRIAIVSEGATQELHIERSQTRGIGRKCLSWPRRPGASRHAIGFCGYRA